MHIAHTHVAHTRTHVHKRKSQVLALVQAYGLSKEEAARALRVKAALAALRRRGWDAGTALVELTAR